MLEDNLYMVCVNASNKQKDYDWFVKWSKNFKDVEVKRQTDYSLLAVQGPNSKDKVALLVGDRDKQRIYDMNFSDNYFFEFYNEKFLLNACKAAFTNETSEEYLECSSYNNSLILPKAELCFCRISAKSFLDNAKFPML